MRKPCCDKQDTNKGAWSKLEDQRLIDYIRKHGEGCWRTLPQAAGLLRCGKSCRLRWINYLRPDVKRGNFAEDEEDLIIKLHALLGNRWSLIAGRLPGRTDNEVKNYWNSHLRRKLISMGIDPNNHRLHHVQLHNSIDNAIPFGLAGRHDLADPIISQQAATVKSPGDNNTDHQAAAAASDAGSCLLEGDQPPASSARGLTTLLPDLNLDLAITINPHNSSSPADQLPKLNQQDDHDQLTPSTSTTLTLFR